MAAPSRLGNLTFSYHKETNGSLKKLRKPRTSDFLNDRNNKTLASSSFIFNKRQQKTNETSHRNKYSNNETSNRDEVRHSKTEKYYSQNVEPESQDYHQKEELQSYEHASYTTNGLYMNEDSDLNGRDQTDSLDDTLERSPIDPLEKLFEDSQETKFYPDDSNHQNGANEIENPQNEQATDVVARDTEETYSTENILSEDERFANRMKTEVSSQNSSKTNDTFSQGTVNDARYSPGTSYNWRSNVSRGDGTASQSHIWNRSTEVHRNVSFSVPGKHPDENNGPVAKVTRSNSKRLINDDNNLKSLFTLARSNENLNNLSDDDSYSKQDHATDESKRQRVVEEFSSKKMDDLERRSSSSRELPENNFYKGREDFYSNKSQYYGNSTANSYHLDEVDSKPKSSSQYRTRSNSLRQNEPPSVNRSMERNSSRVSSQSNESSDESQKHVSGIGNMVNRTQR